MEYIGLFLLLLCGLSWSQTDGMDGFYLYLSNTSITGTQKQIPPGHLCFHDELGGKNLLNRTIPCFQLASHVILYNEHRKDDYGSFLELCDVQIIGCSRERFGDDCKEKCSMKCFDQHCYPSNGSCVWGCNCYDNNCNSDKTCTTGCKMGFGGQHCNENNLATSGLPEQYPVDDDTPARLAIDGIKIGNSCARTSGSVAWWLLDLRKESVIETVYLSFKDNDTVKQYARNHLLHISNSSKTWKEGPVLEMTSNFDVSFPFLIYSIYPAVVGRYIVYEPDGIGGTSHVDICEVEVVGCNLGFYGENCNKTCSQNCIGSCNLTTGVCMFGCKDGWLNAYCNKSCDDTKFGNGCKETCHCYNTTESCNHVTGICPEGGCMKGWKGKNCSFECPTGQHGHNCNESCDGCLSRQCDSKGGECKNQSSCTPGWLTELPFCKTKCLLGNFGKNCTHVCHCQNSAYCNPANGVCSEGGCERGWQGVNCSTECRQGRYGFNCNNACNQCLNNTCNRINGTCTYGCGEGYQNTNCEPIEKSQQQEEVSSGSAGTIAGVAVTAIIIIVVIVVVFLWRRRKGLKNKDAASIRNTRSQFVFSNEVTDDTEKPVGNEYVNVHPMVSARGISVTVSKPADTKDGSEENMADALLKDVGNDYYNDNLYGNIKADQKYKEHNIAIDDLSKFIKDKHMENGFETEFESLPKGHVYPHTEAIKEENKLKNRFLTTWPYDHSRVVLTDNNSSDYINASYIDNFSKEKAYIATQGPKRNTIKDFWEMIWQENVKVIVMVTQLVESGRKKCEQYWPELHEKRLLVGNLKISTSQEKTRTMYVERVFSLLNKKVHTERTIRQFHFTQWPDHGVPDITKLVNFYRKVKKEASHSDIPLVVHCSAGIGRTGTFLAIDALYEHGQRTGFINVMEYAQIMRKNRMNMIQTKDQYQTVFEALLELFTTSETAIEKQDFSRLVKEDQLHPIPKNQTRLYLEFQKLQSLKPSYSRVSYSKANAEENACKNTNVILAHDKYRPILMSSTSDHTDYINAVILPEYNTPTNIIVTQYPLQDTLVDFWTMIYDHNCQIVVMLEETNNKISLWPKQKTAIQFDMLTVQTNEDESNVDIRLTHKSNRENRHIKVIAMNKWNPENIPTSTGHMTDLLQNVSLTREKGVGSVAVVDGDGASRSGLFVALMLVLQKLEIDDEVDIFQVVRMMQLRRPEFFGNYDQYEYCYQFLMEYLDIDSLYANA